MVLRRSLDNAFARLYFIKINRNLYMKLFRYLPIYLLLCSINLSAFNLFKNYKDLPPEQNVQNLTVEQINNPTDPYINYNLGVALYKTEKYDQAKSNFQRCLIHSRNNNLKERGYFNLANCFYKNGLSNLPINWQNKDMEIDQKVLSQAIQEIKESIKNYESTLELNKVNNHAKINLEKAKASLKKLQEKMKQQQQNQWDKSDNKDQKQNQKNETSENKDQDNQQKQKPDSSSDSKEGNDKQNQQQQQAQDKHDSSSQPNDERSGGDQNKSNQDEEQNKKQQNLEHKNDQSNQEQQNQPYKQQGNKSEEQKQEGAQQRGITNEQQVQEKPETAQQKSMRATLDNLQNYESNLQKARVAQKTQDSQSPLKSNQKPW